MNFTRTISTNNGAFEFNFRKLPGDDYYNFQADVSDQNGKLIQFSIYRDPHDRWHASGNPLPLWISDEETSIGQSIEEEISSKTI